MKHRPRRQQRSPKPELWLADYPATTSLALTLWRRIRQVRHARQTGTVIAVDDKGGVYLMCADLPATERFITQHPQWVIGTYASNPHNANAQARVPSVDMILDDLAQRLSVE